MTIGEPTDADIFLAYVGACAVSGTEAEARRRHEAKKLSIKPSPKLYHSSLPTTHSLVQTRRSTVHSRTENVLETKTTLS